VIILAIVKINIITAAHLARSAANISSITTKILLDSLNGIGTSSSLIDKIETELTHISKSCSKL
jgi:hypothetical protein